MTNDALTGDTGGLDDVEAATSNVLLPKEVLLCFSHLRWDFVFQRPQHLMTRFAKRQRVYYIEEPVYEDVRTACLRISQRNDHLRVVVPVLPHAQEKSPSQTLRVLLDRMLKEESITVYRCWYYTPMALAYSDHLSRTGLVYDCMDELSNFIGAPSAMALMERRLLDRAQIVFTGGQSLYEAKRDRHANIHPFPSSIDRPHFASARLPQAEPLDQRNVGKPKLGFFGVIDERFDIHLMAQVAALRPHWQFILLGPVVKIDPKTLPRAPNLHYLGMKSYDELPAYLAGWDVALMPFARNESTRFISPTKTPEYLAGGRPVVSTRIHDVVHPYAAERLVYIADTAQEFVDACAVAMTESGSAWLARVDAFLSDMSWDTTWQSMIWLMNRAARSPLLPSESLVSSRKADSIAA